MRVRLGITALCDIPIVDLGARPKYDIRSPANIFESLSKVAQPVWHTHQIGMNGEGHDPRRILRVERKLVDLVDCTVAIFLPGVMLNGDDRDIVALQCIRHAYDRTAL